MRHSAAAPARRPRAKGSRRSASAVRRISREPDDRREGAPPVTPKLQALERPEPLGDRVYGTLREYLRAGRIATGHPLQEAALAAQLGVSRTPVREALARLASEGLLSSDGRSFIVPSLSEADIDDIYELRLL